MEALPWNPAAEVTDVTGPQSVQDRSGIKHNSYAFAELSRCAGMGSPTGMARWVSSTGRRQTHDAIGRRLMAFGCRRIKVNGNQTWLTKSKR
jgi:hypothetical protein